jgi:hypothetical protein
MVDMHIPYPNIEEDMKFPNVQIVKQILKSVWKLSYKALFGPLKQCFLSLIIYVNLYTCRTIHEEQIIF